MTDRRSVRLLPAARVDLARLEAFLAEKNARAAVRAALAIAAGVRSLAEHAERHRDLTGRGVRELPVRFGRDGYVIQYRVRDAEVLVARIFHVREDR